MINAGNYKHRIEIVKESSKKVDGFKEKAEILVHRTRARIQTTRGYTVLKAGTDFEKVHTNFTIRYTPKPIEQGQTILFKGARYRIEYVNNINESNQEIELQAVKLSKV